MSITIHDKINQLNIFFAYVGKIIPNSSYNKQYLWKALSICQYCMKQEIQNDLYSSEDRLTATFLTKSLSIENLNLISQNHPNLRLGQFASQLKEKFLNDPVIGALPFHLQENLPLFLKVDEPHTFGTKHFSKILHYTILSIFSVIIYYSYISFGIIGLTGLSIFAIYWGIRKYFKQIKKSYEKNSVLHDIHQEIKKSHYESKADITIGKDNLYLSIKASVDNIIVNNMLSIELKKEIEQIKSQILIFSQIYPQKKNLTNLYMEQDILKMVNEHLPNLLNNDEPVKYDEKTFFSTIHVMNKLVQSHLSALVWEDQKDLSVKHRYWLNKLSEENLLIELSK